MGFLDPAAKSWGNLGIDIGHLARGAYRAINQGSGKGSSKPPKPVSTKAPSSPPAIGRYTQPGDIGPMFDPAHATVAPPAPEAAAQPQPAASSPLQQMIDAIMAGDGSTSGGGGGSSSSGGGIDIASLIKPYTDARMAAQAAAAGGRGQISANLAQAIGSINQAGKEGVAAQAANTAGLNKTVMEAQAAQQANLAEAQKVAAAQGLTMTPAEIAQITGSQARTSELGANAQARNAEFTALLPKGTTEAQQAAYLGHQGAQAALETNLQSTLNRIGLGQTQAETSARASNARTRAVSAASDPNSLTNRLKNANLAADLQNKVNGKPPTPDSTTTSETPQAQLAREQREWETMAAKNPVKGSGGTSFTRQLFNDIVAQTDKDVAAKKGTDKRSIAEGYINDTIAAYAKNHGVHVTPAFIRHWLDLQYGAGPRVSTTVHGPRA